VSRKVRKFSESNIHSCSPSVGVADSLQIVSAVLIIMSGSQNVANSVEGVCLLDHQLSITRAQLINGTNSN